MEEVSTKVRAIRTYKVTLEDLYAAFEIGLGGTCTDIRVFVKENGVGRRSLEDFDDVLYVETTHQEER